MASVGRYGPGVSAPDEYQQILYDVSDRVATITLHRPDKLNAFTGTMMREMIDAFDRIDADDDVRAVIVTGSGRAFCAGADLSGGGETFAGGGSDVETRPSASRATAAGLSTLRIFECTKPVIAAINGAAVGVGVTMTLPMDIRLASTTRPVRLRLRPARHRARGRLALVPAADRRHQPGRRVVLHRPHLRRATRHSTGGSCAACTPPDDLLPAAPAIAREIADNTRAGLGRADPPDAVADARRQPSDGGPSRRQPSDPVERGER